MRRPPGRPRCRSCRNEPPSSAARSRIACSPTPGAQRPLGGPLSVIDTSSRSAHLSWTSAPVAREWRTTLVRASVAIRYVATSMAAGSAGTWSGTSSRTSRRPVRPPGQLLGSLPQGSNQPEFVQRGRPQIVNHPAYVGQGSPGSRRRVVSSSSTSRDQSSMVLAAASAVKAIPVRVGPEPVVQFAAQPPALLFPGPRRSAPGTPAAPRKPLSNARQRRLDPPAWPAHERSAAASSRSPGRSPTSAGLPTRRRE